MSRILLIVTLLLQFVATASARDFFGNNYAWEGINTPYTTLTGLTATGFTASRTSTTGLLGAWSAEIPVVYSRSIRVTYDLVLNSGQAPIVQLSRTGAFSIVDLGPWGISNSVTMTAGTSQSAVLTATEGQVGRLIIYNTNATNFVVSNIRMSFDEESSDPTPLGFRFPRIACGLEYLGAWKNAVVNGPAKVLIVGDSTWSDPATNVVSNYNNVSQILTRYLKTRFTNNVTVTNVAVAGSYLNTWLGTTATADIASNPNLIIIGHGGNDAVYHRGTYLNELQTAINTIRASRSLAQTSILITGPVSFNDVSTGRDMDWDRNLNAPLREFCGRNHCGFVDAYTSLPDSETMKGISWDTAGSLGGPIHPLDAINYDRVSFLLDAVAPRSLETVRTGAIDLAAYLTANWVNHGSGFVPVSINREIGGRAFIDGMIDPVGAVTSGQTLFTLPTGYRPTTTEQFYVTTDVGAAVLTIATNGVTTITNWPAGSAYLRLSLSFSTL